MIPGHFEYQIFQVLKTWKIYAPKTEQIPACLHNMSRFMRSVFYLITLSCLIASCAVFKPVESRKASKVRDEIRHSTVFSKAFTGFTLLDPATGKTLSDFHGDHYFTPASNTKILTLATCLAVLGDSVPGALYLATDTALYFMGTGDPTFLHPKFQAWQSIPERLRQAPQKKIMWVPDQDIEGLGPGWAWDDAPFGYSTERSTMPIFGNISHVFAVNKDSIAIDEHNWHLLSPLPDENLGTDKLLYTHGLSTIKYGQKDTFSTGFEAFFPIKDISNPSTGFRKTGGLLELSLNRRVWEAEPPAPRRDFKTWFSTPIDTVLRRMMHQSDNFIAEQMLLASAGVKFDMLEQDTMIKWMLDSVFTSLPQRPKWVDGSGLSRYNLMTPQSIAQVLLRLWKTQPQDRLFSLFPAGGIDGTLKNWYAGIEGKPFVFAKSGSMSGVYCLSGYLVRKNGKVLIFSFMNNNFVGTNKPWKAEIQRLLEMLR